MKGENIGTYLICVSKIFIKGVNTNSKLLYSGCDIFGEMISSELAEDLILKAISVGTDWTDRGGINYRELEDLTLMLQGDLEDKYQEEVIKISSKNFDRAELKKKTVENHLNKKLLIPVELYLPTYSFVIINGKCLCRRRVERY